MLIKCCICETVVYNKQTFIPRKCINRYGEYLAHKICDQCWWDHFADEYADHNCPGCIKGLPLTERNIYRAPIFVDLTTE